MWFRPAAVWRPLLPALLALGVAPAAALDESAARFRATTDSPVVELDGGVFDALGSRIELEIVTPDDEVVARRLLSSPGPGAPLEVALPELATLPEKVREVLAYSRLVLRSAGGGPVEVLTLGRICREAVVPEVFVYEPGTTGVGLTGHVLTRHLVDGTARPGVPVELSLIGEDGELPLTRTVTSDEHGVADFQMALPGAGPVEELDLVATVRNGPISLVSRTSLVTGSLVVAAVATDRPLYRPGETVHFRVLAIEPGIRVLPGAAVEWTFEDPDGVIRHRGAGTTSALGVAHGDWEIPEWAAPGDYDLRVSIRQGDLELESRTEVVVASFELPTIRVEATPVAPYVLPGQAAEVRVTVTTASGESVAAAPVEVHERPDWWAPFAEDDEDLDEEPVLGAGVTGDDGSVVLALDVADEIAWVAEGRFAAYHDLELVARATDPASGRRLERPFELRASRDPVHVRLRSAASNGPGLPREATVTTFRADGEPLSCSVEVWSVVDDDRPVTVLGVVETDAHGVGFLSLEPAEDETDDDLELVARCAGGLGGTDTGWLDAWEGTGLRVRIPKVLLDPGEPIVVEILSGEPSCAVDLVVLDAGGASLRRRLTTTAGHASVALPYAPSFTGRVELLAFPVQGFEEWDGVARAAVLYPDPRTLEVEVEGPERARPGEIVAGRLRLRDRAGTSLAGVAGVAVVDEALEALLSERGHRRAIASFRHDTEARVRGYGWGFAGLTERDLTGRTADTETDDLEGVARVLLGEDVAWVDTAEIDLDTELEGLYREALRRLTAPLRESLEECRLDASRCPRSSLEARDRWAELGLDLELLPDPWGRPLELAVVAEGKDRVLRLISSGADRQPGTGDDLRALELRWPWFRHRVALLEAARKAARRTPCQAPGTAEVLAAAAAEGLTSADLLDPWGRPLDLRVTSSGRSIRLVVVAEPIGPRPRRRAAEPWTVWTEHVDTFESAAAALDLELVRRAADRTPLPASPADMTGVAEAAGLGPDELCDLEGRPLRFEVATVERWADHVEHGPEETTSTPEVARFLEVRVVAVGRDGLAGTHDDIWVATLGGPALRVVKALADTDAADELAAELARDDRRRGGLLVTVVDSTGVRMPGVTVQVAADRGEAVEPGITDVRGHVAFALPAGTYTVTCTLPGFLAASHAGVTVDAGAVTTLTTVLEADPRGQEITVFAAEIAVETAYSVSAMDATNETRSMPKEHGSGPAPLVTPRLRRDFPTTLLWAPEIEVGETGEAMLTVPLADTVTTWRVQVVASTADGRFASADAEIVAALPLVAELPAPQRLTVGDRVLLPVVVRNHESTPAELEVALDSTSAALGIDADTARLRVGGGGQGRVVVPVRALAPDPGAVLRATVRGPEVGDAVERPLAVAPHARQQRTVAGALLATAGELTLSPPEDARARLEQVALEVFPDLGLQLEEAVDGMLRRPGGCAEQIASAAAARLLLAELRSGSGDEPGAAVARELARVALVRLGDRVAEGGGLAYWRGRVADPSLTAHALRVAAAAGDAGLDDPPWRVGAARWLAGRLGADGVLPARHADGADLAATADVAWALAAGAPDLADVRDAAERALDAVLLRLGHLAEPHAIATAALAAAALGRDELAGSLADRLEALARREGATLHWELPRNTPLAGWGLPGRVETTALAVRVLLDAGRSTDSPTVAGGLAFLLRHKDADGAWYSTAATVAVLGTLVGADLGGGTPGGHLEILADGRRVGALELPAAGTLPTPLRLELPPLPPGTRVELVRSGGSSWLEADLAASWTSDWSTAAHTGRSPLRLEVAPERTRLNVGDRLRLRVHLERVGHRGYGMLLAQIGLAPGFEVDRGALERQLGQRFEVCPDRVVMYLWPAPGGETVLIDGIARLAGEMWSAPSELADYYNPLAVDVVPPIRFTVSP